jgi:hypothetical protein
MKRGWIFVSIFGIAFFAPCVAQTDLWRFNSPMDFTSGPEVNVNNFKIWTINSPMQFTPTLSPGIAKGINSTPGMGIILYPGVAKGISSTPGIDKGITLTPGIARGINKTLFMCNIV